MISKLQSACPHQRYLWCTSCQTRCRAIAETTARCALYISYSTLIFYAYGYYTLRGFDLNEFKLQNRELHWRHTCSCES